jgi:hypothetical protein
MSSVTHRVPTQMALRLNFLRVYNTTYIMAEIQSTRLIENIRRQAEGTEQEEEENPSTAGDVSNVVEELSE